MTLHNCLLMRGAFNFHVICNDIAKSHLPARFNDNYLLFILCIQLKAAVIMLIFYCASLNMYSTVNHLQNTARIRIYLQHIPKNISRPSVRFQTGSLVKK